MILINTDNCPYEEGYIRYLTYKDIDIEGACDNYVSMKLIFVNPYQIFKYDSRPIYLID